MKRALIFIVLCAGAAQAAEPARVLSVAGLGKAEIGMTVDKLEQSTQTKLGYNQWTGGGCSVLTTKLLEPTGVSYVIESKILTRISVDFYGTDPRPLEIKTPEGIGLGSSEEDLTKAYAGRMRIERNPLDPAWHTIFVDQPDHNSALVFETNGKSVKSMRVGQYPAVGSRTGCD